MNTDVLLMESVELAGGIKLSDVSAVAGDILWAETASPLYSDVVISMLLGLIGPDKGRYRLAGTRPSNRKQKKLISYFSASWGVGVKDAETFVKMIALNYDKKISPVSSEFKRIMKGLGAEYALKVKFDELKPATKSIVSVAATLSLPFLIILLKEPYYGLEKQAADLLTSEILRLSKDGSLVVVFSGAPPPGYTKQFQIVEEF